MFWTGGSQQKPVSQTQCRTDCSDKDWCQAFHFEINATCALFVSAAFSSSVPDTPDGYQPDPGNFTEVFQALGPSHACFKKQDVIDTRRRRRMAATTTTTSQAVIDTRRRRHMYEEKGNGECVDDDGNMPYCFWIGQSQQNAVNQTQCEENCSNNDWCQAYQIHDQSLCALFVSSSGPVPNTSSVANYHPLNGNRTEVSQAFGPVDYECYKKQVAGSNDTR